MDDINNKKSLREVLPKHSSDENPTRREIKTTFTVPEPKPIMNKTPRRAGMPVKGVVIAVTILVLVLGGIVGSSVFAKATIAVTPRQADIVLDGGTTFEAKSTPADETELLFGTVSKNFTETKVVAATGEKDVSVKASGTIIIYNAFDDKPATLVATTRFETPDGKIYRIDRAVTVPGMKGATPGAVEATVSADQAGAEYNIGLSDFSVPGLKSDTARFSKVYARSKTPMTGGMVGKTKIVSEADQKAAEEQLKTSLTSKAGSAISLDVPEGQILLPDSTLTSFEAIKVVPGGSSNQATLSLTLAYTGILVKREDLAKFLAYKYVPEYQGEPVDIESLEAFKFSLKNKDSLNPASLSTINFSLEGKGRLVWTFDEAKLKESLKGLSKSTYSEKLSDFPAIQSSSVSVMPPWKFSFPNDVNKIEIETKITK